MIRKIQKDNRTYFVIAIIGILMVILMDSFLFRMEYRNYKVKMLILCTMIETKDSVQTAADLLKGTENIKVQNGVELLGKYGYLSEYENEYHKEFKKEMLLTVIISFVLYLVFLGLIHIIRILERKKKNQSFRNLESILSNFRNGIYEITETEEFSEMDAQEDRIYAEIESLGAFLNTISKKMSREKEETKSLVTDISHQLKTPVAALKTCFEILQQEDLTPEERECFSKQCSQQLKGLENLVSSLINISRMEIGMIEIKKENASIFDTIVGAVNRIYLKAEEKDIEIEMESEDKLQQLKLPHDRKWLCEAFINVLENAVKYSPVKTCITIRLLERITFLRIEIEDHGIGISKNEYNEIFKRFYRGKSEHVKKQTGSGVGLYLTREIISMHNGTITVSSQNDKGSTFIIQLPYKL